jgi:hypothetical protein
MLRFYDGRRNLRLRRLFPVFAGIAGLVRGFTSVSTFACLLGWALPCLAQDYPLAVGTQWTLHLRQELGPGVHFSDEDAALAKGDVLDTTVVSRVVAIDPVNGAKYSRVESRRNGKLWLEEWLRLGSDGLLLAKSIDHSTGDETEMLPPQRFLSSALSPGESWTWKHSLAPVSSRTTIGAAEKTVVPAGTYDAVRVTIETTFATEGQPLKVLQVRWFVPGVGYVKQETRAEIAGRMLMHTLLTLEKFERASAR